MDPHTLAVLHAAPTWFLTGLIWFVQIAHYPLFPLVGDRHFAAYERAYTARVTRVVLPAMLAELALALWLWWIAPPAQAPWATTGLLLLAAVWASTFLLQVSCHAVLARHPDARTMRRLVATNWLRTAAWTLRAGIALRLLLPA